MVISNNNILVFSSPESYALPNKIFFNITKDISKNNQIIFSPYVKIFDSE